MKIVILTSDEFGTAAHHLPMLLQSEHIEVTAVILNRGVIKNRWKHYQRKLKKMWKIGLMGALNGMRMRNWFSTDVQQLLGVSSIRQQCTNAGIPLYETDSINTTATESMMHNADADLGISLGNSFIAPRIFNIPKHGMINIHHEILPDYQNAQSVIWQLYHGSTETGYTIHQIERKIDAGKILYKEHLPIVFHKKLNETVSHTVARLWEHSAKGLVNLIEHFDEYYAKARPQGGGRHFTTPSFWQFQRIRRQHKRLKKKNL